MKSVLVTGGAGFIGSSLVRRLLTEPGVERIGVVDNLMTGHMHNLAEISANIEIHQVDIRDRQALRPLFKDVDLVFHQAAIPSVPRSIKEPVLTHEVNVEGTVNVLLAARDNGVQRVVYAASSSAYGDSETLPKHEQMPANPKSPYAVQKHIGELYCRQFYEHYGLETVSLRYFNVFGPRQDPSSPYSGVLSLFCTAALEGTTPMIFGDGEQSRDFTFVDNVVNLNLLAARVPSAAGQLYNGGTGQRYTLNCTWDLLQGIAGVRVAPEHGAPREGDVRHSQADISKVQSDLGYQPQVGFEEGLRRTLEWYRGQSL